jgi:tetratricopeptide (TPR) repeat protein
VHLNPSLAVAHASIGSTHILAGEPEMAIEPLRTALRLSPDDFYIFHTLGELAIAHAMMGDDALAVATAERSLAARPGYLYAHVVRIGALARLNRTADAQAALAQMLSCRPDFRMRDIEWVPFLDRHWVTFLIEGLRLAGFDEPRIAVELLNTSAERRSPMRAFGP